MSAERPDLVPPPDAGSGRSIVLSLLAHVLLGIALAWGVSWTPTDPQVSFSAELWSATVQEAAPAAVEPPPAPPPPPAPAAKPEPPPPAARAPEPSQADIAIEREKKRKLEEDRKKAEALKDKQAKEKAEKEDKAKQAAKERKEKEQAREEARKAQARKEAAEAQAAEEKRRQDQVRRIQGLAGATGAPEARGTAPRASAPSSSYAGKIVEQIKNNTSFTDASAGRPTVVVLVKTSATGAVLSSKVVTPSGNKAWDEAVLRAVQKMGTVPRDVDGRIPEVLLQEGLELKVTL